MGYTVSKREFEHKLRPSLEKQGVKITSEVRGDERNVLDDFVGAIYPGDNILTDYVYFESSDNDKAKAEIDRLGMKYYAPDTGEETIGGGIGFNPGGCLFFLVLIAMAAAAFMD